MTPPNQTAAEHRASEVVSGEVSGGTNTSHTIAVGLLDTLLDEVPQDAPEEAYRQAVIDENLLGRETAGGRRRTFRYLRELYLLRPNALLFRALRDLWAIDPKARPLLAGLCALARDAVFRASAPAIIGAKPGDQMTSRTLAEAVGAKFPSSYGDATLLKIGRNTFSSWEQTGHLKSEGRAVKVRRRADCHPSNVAYALLLGHIEGHRGDGLFRTVWTDVLDESQSRVRDLAIAASQQGLINMRESGGIIQIDFGGLLRPFEGELV